MVYKILIGGYSTLLTTFLFDPSSSPPSLSILYQSPSGLNASWLVPHPQNTSVIFGNQEIETAGFVASYVVDYETGEARIVSNISSEGGAPAHLAVLSDLSAVVVVNYNTGNGAVLPLDKDGVTVHPAPPEGRFAFNGSGPSLPTQATSHAHMALQADPHDPHELLISDLGSDKVWRMARSSLYNYTITGYIQQPLGSGPRHGLIHDPFSNSTSYLYEIHQISNIVTQQPLLPPGSPEYLQPPIVGNASTLVPTANASIAQAAELLLSPTAGERFPERYLYASNRGELVPPGYDTIAIMRLSPLDTIAQIPTGLIEVRGMMLGGDEGQYLIAGGQYKGGVVVFERTQGGENLTTVVRLNDTRLEAPTSFVWLKEP